MGEEQRHYPRTRNATACRISLVRTPFSMSVKLARGTIDVSCMECKSAMGWVKKEPAQEKNYQIIHTSRRQTQRPKY